MNACRKTESRRDDLATRLPVAEARVTLKKVALVRREIRLSVLAVRALAFQDLIRRSGAFPMFLAFTGFHDLLVTGASPMQNRFLGGGKVHQAERAVVRCRCRALVLALLRISRDVVIQPVALERDQRADNLGALIASDDLLILIGRGVARIVAGLLGVRAQLEIVPELPIATAAA